MKGFKDNNKMALLVLLGLVLVSTTVMLYSDLSRTRTALREAREGLGAVSGIIVSLDRVEYEDDSASFFGLLRLTTDDGVNDVGTGEISDYRMILDEYVELRVGNLVSGVPMRGEIPALRVECITPFFHPPIINTGEYIEFEVVELNTVGPSLYLGLHNLGEKDIIAVRAEVNGTLIPFFFGVDKEHPVKPYGYVQDSVPTSWFDPRMNGTAGFKPVHGETYPVVVEITISDDRPFYLFKTVRTWNFSVTAVSGHAIASMVDTGTHIEMKSAYIFGHPGEEDFLSLVIRNVWRKKVTGIAVFVDDVQVADVRTNLKTGSSWRACIGLPFNVYLGSSHNVTIRALTAEGDVAEVSREVICDRI